MRHSKAWTGRTALGVVSVAAVLVASACSSSGGSGHRPSAGTSSSGAHASSAAAAHVPHRGGSLTVLEDQNFAGGWPSGLDPATNTNGGGNLSQNQAIFGGLFLIRANDDGSDARVVPYQASGGTLSKDAKTLTIKVRPGLKFSDGTPLDAQAVLWNLERDTKSSCTCAPKWELRKSNPFTSPDPLTVVVHFSAPNAAVLHNFPVSNVNWMASPSAYKKMGAKQFAVAPVGAGPFTVVSDKLSAVLVLKRNPSFFVKGQPYLDGLTFQSIGGDQAAYQALLAGQAQAYEGMSTQPVIKQAEQSGKLQVTPQPGTSPYVVQVNTLTPPFDNIKAREALYYATDWNAIVKGLFDGKPTVVQGFTTPADLYYHQKTPGYRTYDLAKAKALVKELGGLRFQLDTISVYSAKEVSTALQTQWQQAGMKVTMKAFQLNGLIQRYTGGKWQSDFTTAGAWDPAAGTGIDFVFNSNSPFSGVKDPHLDKLLAAAVSTANDAQRDSSYQQVAKYISDKAYGTFGFAFAPTNLAAKGVHGPGLTTKIPAVVVNTGIIWSEVWRDNG